MLKALPSSICSLILLFSLTSAQDTSSECSCFRTNGSSAGYFTSHQFFDYRNLSPTSEIPSLISNISSTTDALATSDFFTNDAWTTQWTAQNWNNSDNVESAVASVMMVNSPNNVYIELDNSTNTSHLTLRTARLPDFQSAAEIDSTQQNYHHLSARFLARVTGSPGACAGLFTYLQPNSNAQDVQEADIEILTSGPRNSVQYTNQPSTDKNGNDVPKATVNGTLRGRDWSEWNVYRVDWMEGLTSWYVNGVSVANISFQTPKDPSGLILNMWSDGGMWTGNMSVFDEAFLQVRWIEVAYNTSGSAGGSKRRSEGVGAMGELVKRKGTPGCKVVCGVDEGVNVTGSPVVLYNNTGMAAGGIGSGTGLTWVPVVLVLGAVLGYF